MKGDTEGMPSPSPAEAGGSSACAMSPRKPSRQSSYIPARQRHFAGMALRASAFPLLGAAGFAGAFRRKPVLGAALVGAEVLLMASP